ncbi:MAG: SIS domain-containing protein [Chloroflexota bacterium]
MSHLQDEIQSQPTVLANLLDKQRAHVYTIAEAIRDFNPAFVMIAARGTSDNAARYAQYALGIRAKLPVALATPSVHTLYDTTPKLSNALVIGISQSGQSADVRQVISDAKAQGALTLSITNDPESPLAMSTDYHIALGVGVEKSVAATKTYTGELLAISMLVQALTESPYDDLAQVPQWVDDTLSLNTSINDWAQRYRYINRLATIGRGYNYCTAFEISLKIKELCYIVSEQYSEADFRHGPIAIVEDGFSVIVVAPQGKPQAQMLDLLAQLHSKNAECLVISNDDKALATAQNPMHLPKDIPEWLSPICAVIPGQYFAMYLAGERGLNIDEPRNLNKVTSTE